MGEPIRIPRRKSSFSIEGTRRRRSSAVRVEMSSVVKQRVREARINVEQQQLQKQKEKEKGLEKDKQLVEEPEPSVEPEPALTISETERHAKYKWLMSKSKGKLVRVAVDLLEGVEAESMAVNQYEITNKIVNVKQLRGINTEEDAHMTQHLRIDEDQMTMADLCKPLFPIGEVSKDYERAKEGERKRLERSKLLSEERKMARRLRLNEKELAKFQQHSSLDTSSPLKQEQSQSDMDQKASIKRLMEVTESPTKINVPLLQIQNGQVVYSQESTQVNRHESTNDDLERIEENPFENIVTSNTYSKRKATLNWTPQETAELFKAISMWGTDFTLIAQLFPYRTRKQIKAKFVSEERRHPHLVEFALLRKLPVDIQEYAGKTGKDFKTLDEYNEELAQVRQKHEEELQSMAIAKQKAIQEDKDKQFQRTDVKPRSRKAVIAEFRRNEEVVGSLD